MLNPQPTNVSYIYEVPCNPLNFNVVYTGPYLGFLPPGAQENFAPPPPLFVRIQLCVSKNKTKKLTKDKT
jgi:hypothetical protein